jgi:hypothetical protein
VAFAALLPLTAYLIELFAPPCLLPSPALLVCPPMD